MSDNPQVQSVVNSTTKAMDNFGEQIKSNKTGLVIIATIVIVFFIIFVSTKLYYKFTFKPYLQCNGCFKTFIDGPVSVSGKMPIPYDYLPTPIDNTNYAYTMWVNISNWYHNYGKWKHVYHHGAAVAMSCLQNLSWDRIQSQSPGIWFAPEKNDLRIVITTRNIIPKKCTKSVLSGLGLSPSTEKFVDYVEEFANPSCDPNAAMQEAWKNADGTKLAAYLSKNPNGLAQCSVADVKSPTALGGGDFDGVTLLEYVDFENVPVGEWFQIGVVVRQKELELYINGRLAKSQLLIGVPEMVKANGYFGLGGSFAGQISNFRYYPRETPARVLDYVYKEEAKKSWITYYNTSSI